MEVFHLTSRRFTTLLILVAPFIAPVYSQYRASQADLDAWFRTTTATVRFTGASFSAPLGPQDARIIYCTAYDHDSKICGSGGECFAYQGPVNTCMKPEKMFQCVAAFNTNVCMGYSEDCTISRECIFTSTCEDRLANGFCLGIDSISLGFPDPINNPRQPLPSPSPSTPPPTSQSSSRAQDPSSSSTPSSAASESSSTSSSSDSESSALPTTRRSASFETFIASSGSASGPSSSSTGSTTPGSSTSGEERSGSSLPIGAMVGIALGGLLVGIVSILLVLCIRRRRKRAASRTPPSNLPVLLTPVTPSAPWQPIQDSPPIAQYHTKSYLDSPNPDSPAGFPSSDSATTTSAFDSESYREHSDSGVRLNPPAHQQTSRTMVELPPPYSQG